MTVKHELMNCEDL